MNYPSDLEQRKRACDLQHSYIVQAPAGSGKTELLTQRMLGLLSLVENPEEVVAITFTRKAAAEMSNRLFKHLQAAFREQNGEKEDQPLEPHEQVSRELALAALKNDSARGWNLLEQPSRLRIRTIDSLCSELARQLPVLSGLGGGQQITTDATALYRKAAVRTMSVIEDNGDELQDDIERILGRYDNQYDRLVELLTTMLASREQWIGHLLAARIDDGFDRQAMEYALRTLIETQLETARQVIPDQLLVELPRLYNYAIGNDAENSIELKALLEACGGDDCDFLDLPASSDALPHWRTMISSLLTQNGEMRKSAPSAIGGFPPPSGAKGEEKARRVAFKDDFKSLLDEHRDNDGLIDNLNTVSTLPCPEYEDEAWESLESLMRILIRAAGNWELVIAETGEVDFGEIAFRAIRSLGDENAPSDLALRMDYRIQHLLVDEFQDTSASQIRLLDRLTAGWCDGDGRTLFLVGDPMQSIYRFRKAEVSLFIKAWDGNLFDHILLQPLRLTVNFRSNKPIVDWVNQSFPMVMPSVSDPVMGAVSYSDADFKPGVSDVGTVAIDILPDRDDEEEARKVIELIDQRDPDETCAILVRSRSHASTILSRLDSIKATQPGFRYQAIEFTPLTDTSLVQDLVSLTLALMQPVDRLAWLAVLRAPYIGLDLADLDILAGGDSREIILDKISEAVHEEGTLTLSADGRQRILRAGQVILQTAERRGREPIRSLVESTWIALGGPACVEGVSELDDAATYFELLDALEKENLSIDRDTLDVRLKDLYAKPDSAADGKLQVLTIYAAKGLQFDTVILPGLHRPPGSNDNKLLHWFEFVRENQIVMSPMRNSEEKELQKKSGDLIKFISGVEKQRQNLEDGRLLYVATTRAKRKLYLFGAIKPTVKGVIKPLSRSLLGCLWPAIQGQQLPLVEQAAEKLASQTQDAAEETGTPPVRLPQEYRRLTADWQLPDRPEPVRRASIEPNETQSYIEFSWAGEDARHTGNLVHRLLQLVGEIGVDSFNANGGMDRHLEWCRQSLLSEGIQKAKAEAIVSRATRAIENCLASEQGRWIFEEHEEAHCEYALTAVLDGRPRNLILDRTFVEHGTRWIIDYKTSTHGGGDLEGFLLNETGRYREQLARYKNAISLTDTRPIKTALYFPMLDRLLEVKD